MHAVHEHDNTLVVTSVRGFDINTKQRFLATGLRLAPRSRDFNHPCPKASHPLLWSTPTSTIFSKICGTGSSTICSLIRCCTRSRGTNFNTSISSVIVCRQDECIKPRLHKDGCNNPLCLWQCDVPARLSCRRDGQHKGGTFLAPNIHKAQLPRIDEQIPTEVRRTVSKSSKFQICEQIVNVPVPQIDAQDARLTF